MNKLQNFIAKIFKIPVDPGPRVCNVNIIETNRPIVTVYSKSSLPCSYANITLAKKILAEKMLEELTNYIVIEEEETINNEIYYTAKLQVIDMNDNI